jgi:O-antigen/teichoic acid export membrane protein
MQALVHRVPRHLAVAASAWASRAVTAVLQVVSVRVLIDSLGVEGYAVFAVFAGLLPWFMLSDLGIGFSLQNHIAELRARGRGYAHLVLASGAVGGALAVVLPVLTLAAAPVLGPFLLAQFGFLTPGQKAHLFLVAALLSLAMGVGSIAYRVWYGEQRGYLANLVPGIGSLLAFAAICGVARWAPRPVLAWQIAASLAPLALLPLAAFASMVWKSYRRAGGRAEGAVRPLLSRAGGFWTFALLSAAVLQIDYIVLARTVPADQIVVYNICARIFGLAHFMYTAVLFALMPTLTECFGRGDLQAVRRHVARTVGFGLAFMLSALVVLVFAMQPLSDLLTGGERVAVPRTFIVLMGAYFLMRVWTDTFASVLQSRSTLRPFMVYVPVQAALSVALQLLLAPRYGISGVVAGLLASFVLTVGWALPMHVYRQLRAQPAFA